MRQREVDNETAQRVVGKSAAHVLSPGEDLRAVGPASGTAIHAIADLEVELENLALKLPTLPDHFSRADIYDEHD